MKILVITQYFWPESFRINDICEGLKSKGHELHVITSLPNVPEGRFYKGYSLLKKGPKEYKGISLERVRVVPRGKSNFLLLAINCFTFAVNSLFHIPKHIRRGYDAVFVFEPSPLSVAVPAIFFRLLTKKKIPLFLYVQDIWPQSMYLLLGFKEGSHKLLRSVMGRICSKIHRKFDTLLLSSPGFFEKLKEQGVEAEKMVYFPNWAEETPKVEYDIEIADKYAVNGKFVIMFAGNLGRAQGLDAVIEAAKLTSENKNIIWMLVGDGTEAERLKEKVVQYGLEDTVFFPGWQSKSIIGRFYSLSCVLLVSLLDNEVLNITIPSKIQTYMLMCKPIIAFMNGIGASLIKDSGAGISVEAGNSTGLAEAVKTLYKMDKEDLKNMGENALTYCKRNFSRDILIEKLESVICNKN
jgi:glycosyltransferase involved in cell wall biosynthesis